jgi:hypothetical protein
MAPKLQRFINPRDQTVFRRHRASILAWLATLSCCGARGDTADEEMGTGCASSSLPMVHPCQATSLGNVNTSYYFRSACKPPRWPPDGALACFIHDASPPGITNCQALEHQIRSELDDASKPLKRVPGIALSTKWFIPTRRPTLGTKDSTGAERECKSLKPPPGKALASSIVQLSAVSCQPLANDSQALEK